MESKQVAELVGSEVIWLKDNSLADIVSYEKGWVTIKTDDEKEHKVRAKDIVLTGTEDDLVENEDGELETIETDPSEDSSSANSAAQVEEGMDIICSCGNTFPAPKLESFKCPACGKWHYVRLHPDLEKYVKGLDETPSGRDTLDINDDIAEQLRGMNLEQAYDSVCASLDELDPKAKFSKAMAKDFEASDATCSEFLQDRYGELNNGMQRMNIGNLLRGAVKRNVAIKAKVERDAKTEENKEAE